MLITMTMTLLITMTMTLLTTMTMTTMLITVIMTLHSAAGRGSVLIRRSHRLGLNSRWGLTARKH